MNALHLLLNSPDSAAGDILSLVAECGNAKEVVLAVQESLGFLRIEVGADELDPDVVFRRLERLLSSYVAGKQVTSSRGLPTYESSHPKDELQEASSV